MSSDSKILQLNDLLPIPVSDNGEPLTVIESDGSGIECEYQKFDMIPYTGKKMYVREGVGMRLQKAAATLRQQNSALTLKVVYAYRHPEIQRKYHEARILALRKENPVLGEAELALLAHLFVADPRVAGHPTGGAVDLTIVENGLELEMGTKIADFSNPELIETFAGGLTKEQEKNRLLLRSVMIGQNFAPFNGEWWHFSYGDREWAAYYGRPAAMYGECDFRT